MFQVFGDEGVLGFRSLRAESLRVLGFRGLGFKYYTGVLEFWGFGVKGLEALAVSV